MRTSAGLPSASVSARRLQGLLIDIDGVLRVGVTPIPGAVEAVRELRRRGVPFRFLTNVTMKSRAQEAERLGRLGFVANATEIYTASFVAAEFLRRQGAGRCWVLLNGSARDDFYGLELTEQRPEYVVLGDVGDDFSAELLHRAYRELLAGATLIAIQRNRAWTGDDGLPRLDVGAWAAALEYASGQQALVMGKPSALAYELPAQDLGLSPTALGMVADDPDVDLAGARAAGLSTILVGTTSLPLRRPVAAAEFDFAIDSIADLPTML